MTSIMSDTASRPGLTRHIRRLYDRLGLLPFSIIQLMARLSVAVIFWRSGHTKLANWDLTLQLFANEYKVPVLPPEIAAPLAASFELSCSTLLALGLLTRLATLPLIGMTLTIQLFVYPMSWPDHLTWLTSLILLLTRGPGVISLDHLVAQYFTRRHG
jgi:putative oxidoreductase